MEVRRRRCSRREIVWVYLVFNRGEISGDPGTEYRSLGYCQQDVLSMHLHCPSASELAATIRVMRYIGWFFVCLWGCGSYPPVERESWTESASILLRASLDFSQEVLPVDERMLAQFYAQRKYRPAWCGPTGPRSQADALLWKLRQSAGEGLRPEYYAFEEIEVELAKWRRRGTKPGLASLVRLDVLLTRAFFAYGGHLQRGRVDPRAIHSEWKAPVQVVDLVGLLQTALDLQQIESALDRLRPPQRGYLQIRKALRDYRAIEHAGGWPEVKAEGGGALIRRLAMVGDLPEGLDVYSSGQIAEGIAGFQGRRGLLSSGRLDSATLAALNVPVEDRVASIELNMERWRWLPYALGTSYILVRIADFELDVVEAGESVLIMRVFVGKPYWRTPIFSTELTHIVLNPYWYIPQSIAVEEILPKLKQDPDYLVQRSILVRKKRDLASMEIDSQNIDWNTLSSETFAYTFTQSPGPANPLGAIKFMLPNPYNVYLHDTPNRELFAARVRTFSHGCIRLEKSAELAAHVLGDDGQWTLDQIRMEIDSGNNREITLENPMPIYIIYWTTWVDEAGLVQFRRDEYDADERLRRALIRQ